MPDELPIGLLLARTAKQVTRAFELALAERGGSTPMWLILVALVRQPLPHAELAARVGIRGSTLTHHLDRLAEAGFISRTRSPTNRRVQFTELTVSGRTKFLELRGAARLHDTHLRSVLTNSDATAFRAILMRLEGEFGLLTGAPDQLDR